MIKKLRIKLIIAAMVSLFIVLVVVMGSVSILNYRELVNKADRTLSILKENDGVFPDMSGIDKDKHFKKEHFVSPELPYESRYFSVFLNDNGEAIAVNTGKIAAVDTSAAIEYAKLVLRGGHTKGFTDSYRYIMYDSGAETHIIFLDCGRSISTFRTYMLIGEAVSIVGFLAVLLLVILFSRHIVKPFAENYEKQKRFITDAGHELKTPLTIIDADAEVLEMDCGGNEWIDDIRAQTRRLADLTNDLILLSRMEEEQYGSQMIEFPLSDIAEETAKTFQVLAKTQNKTLISEIRPMISMYGEEKAIRQLINILLDNAVKYSDPGGEIDISLEKQKNQIRLRVSNTTGFISRDSIEHLFDRFYRTDKSRNSQTGGYGLGLSIALAIVNAHRGKITASTRDEKSLQITVIFPA